MMASKKNRMDTKTNYLEHIKKKFGEENTDLIIQYIKSEYSTIGGLFAFAVMKKHKIWLAAFLTSILVSIFSCTLSPSFYEKPIHTIIWYILYGFLIVGFCWILVWIYMWIDMWIISASMYLVRRKLTDLGMAIHDHEIMKMLIYLIEEKKLLE